MWNSIFTFLMISLLQDAKCIRLRSKDACVRIGTVDDTSTPLWTGSGKDVWGNDLWKARVSPRTEEQLRFIILKAPPGVSLVVGGSLSSLGWPLHPATANSILISMWKFKAFSVDECEETLTVQAGVTFSDVGPFLSKLGLVVPFYYLFKGFTLIGAMSSGSSPLGVGQPSHSPAHFVKSMKVMNGKGEVAMIDVDSDEERASAWLNSIGDLGIVLEATFKLEKDHYLESSCKDDVPGIEAALRGHDNYGESTIDITPSDPGCNDPMSKSRQISVCKWSRRDKVSKKTLDLEPQDMVTPLAGLKGVDENYTRMQCPQSRLLLKANLSCAAYMAYGSPVILATTSLDRSNESSLGGGSITARSVSNDMVLENVWDVPKTMPHITTLFVQKKDIEATLAEIEEIRDQPDIPFHLNALTVHNYPGSHQSILLSHKDGFMLYLNSFDADGLNTWVSRLLHRLICNRGIPVGWKLANNFPREWIGAYETTFPSLKGLRKFKNISVIEDPFDKFSNVLTREMFKRLSFPKRVCQTVL